MAVLRSPFYRIRISSGACYFRAPSVAILTSLHPAVNLSVLLWKTRSRPSRVRVCPAARFDFSALHLTRVHGQWLFFVRMIRDVQPQHVTPENEGADDTSSPSPPKFTFFDDPDVPFRPRPQGPGSRRSLLVRDLSGFCDNSFVAPACGLIFLSLRLLVCVCAPGASILCGCARVLVNQSHLELRQSFLRGDRRRKNGGNH